MFGRKKKTDPDQMHAAGVQAMESGDYQTAVKTFANLCDVAPTSERLYYLGVLFDMIGATPGALGALRASVEMDPQNSQAFYSLAIVNAQAEDFEASYQAVRSAYLIDPSDFRVVNHYVNMILKFPDGPNYDPAEALKLAKHACELTDWDDDICKETYRLAKEANGSTEATAEVQHEAHIGTPEDATQEIIAHFEKRFARKANELSLQNIIPMSSVSVAVQTIEAPSPNGTSVIFTTGMSAQRMKRMSGSGLEFAEMLMVIPGDWKVGQEINERIWPWHRLQQLANIPFFAGKDGYAKEPQAVAMTDWPEKLGDDTDFAAFLLIPNLSSYVESLALVSGRHIDFIVAMPIYTDEYELTQQPDGLSKLISLIKQTKTKPQFVPNRKSVVG